MSQTGPPPTRGVTPARVVALTVIALLIAGLVYLRQSAGEQTVSVPAGAKAGDLTAMKPCDFAAQGRPVSADCGTLAVPENRANPQSRLIALPVVRIPAQSKPSAQPLFYLEGGPGITNMSFPWVRNFAKNRDVVLVGYRGVDGSVRLDCPEVDSAVRHSTDFTSEASYRAYGDAMRVCAVRLTAAGVDLAGYGFPQEVDDIEAARTALGYRQIDLLSQSAGTRTAQIYAERFPGSIHRSVMVGVNPPGNLMFDRDITDQQIVRYADYCAKDTSCSSRTGNLAATMERTSADMPDHWGPLPINAANVRLFTFYGLMESTSTAGPLAAPWALDSWLAAGEGDPSGLWLQSFIGEIMPIPFVYGQYAAAGSIDARAAKDYFAKGADITNLGYVASAMAWGGGQMADGWPRTPNADRYHKARVSKVETLLIGGELDFSTPPQTATKELLPSLPNGRQVVLPGFGHTLTFFSEQQKAGSHLVNTFLDSGRVDTSLYQPQHVDFTPQGTLPSLAKSLATIMLALVLLAALLLAALSHRSHRRGRIGPAASALSRSVGALLLGAGGWVLGDLVAYTLMPSVPLGSAVLSTVSVGVPVALGIHLAWSNRDSSRAVRRTGLAVALAGSLLGAWLGFFAVEGMLAPVGAIVGAGVGANLGMLVLDIMNGRRFGGQAAQVAMPAPRTEHVGSPSRVQSLSIDEGGAQPAN